MRRDIQRAVRLAVWLFAVVVAVSEASAAPPLVGESARGIPVAYEVDVVVVGGSTGAVSAALSAAEAGAKVFLAAPRPYLGDDMTATLRLWLEPGEEPVSPLAKAVFTDPVRGPFERDPNAANFLYEADRPSSVNHKDSAPPSKLSDGQWSDAARHSVQFDSDVVMVADLQEEKPVEEVRLITFYRSASGGRDDFKVQRVTVSTSSDKQSWQEAGAAENTTTDPVAVLSIPVKEKARYVKLAVQKADNTERILLGEIEIIGPAVKRAEAGSARQLPRPMHVKKTLDDALLAAGVEYLYSCYPADLLRDAQGKPCGIVMANRAGRQAVLAKTIIDATDRAVVARLAGAPFPPLLEGGQRLNRVVIGGEVQTAKNVTARTIAPPFRGRHPNPAGTSSDEFQVIEYTITVPIEEDSPAAWAKADQQARTMTYHPEQQFTSDVLFWVPTDPMIGRDPWRKAWPGVEGLLLGAFQPKDVERIYVLSGYADMPRDQSEKLLRPIALMDMGTRIGAAAAEEARKLSQPAGVRVTGKAVAKADASGDVGEFLVGVRPIQELDTIHQDAQALPVLGEYDVVVIGGGTAGAPAGIAAARQGAKTLVVEYLQGLGGVGTAGAISKYYWGNRVGFAATVEEASASWVIEQRMEWWRKNLLDAGADIWFGVIGCGAFFEGDQVKGVVVATPQGRGVVLAKAVIDATGNADVAAAAGAKCTYTDETEFAMQGTGLPFRQLGETYTNTDFTITDETDVVDVWHIFVYAKDKYDQAFDQGQLVDTRERRRIVGDFTMNILDQINGRTYPDTVVVAYSNFDTHGYTVDPYFELEHPQKIGFRVNVPYRCLLPEGWEGILVGGLGMSAHRDAVPMTRMQPDLQNQGYAMGVAAAMAAEQGVGLRKIDIRELQKHLIEVGNVPETVLTDKDSFPLPDATLRAAVQSVKDHFKGVAALLTQPAVALPLVREAYANAEGEAKLVYAQILAVLGDNTGVETLIAAVDRADKWDEGWKYKGGGQFGWSMSPLDQWIVALGRTRDKQALPAIVRKLEQLTAESEFSHHRAVGLALELIGAPEAAMPLAGLLTRPDISGFVHDTIAEAKRREVPGGNAAVQTRSDSIRELCLARALYRCGDYGGIGERILQNYTRDLRGHLARHAKAVLDARSKQGTKVD